MKFNPNLIYDIGMSEGNDTEFYLRKGFNVVGVEADPATYKLVLNRFGKPIDDGLLFVENKAASEHSGKDLLFYKDPSNQGQSSLVTMRGKNVNDLEVHTVKTICWSELIGTYGVPYYLKMDIEGGEPSFLAGMIDTEKDSLPPYISSEIMTFDPIALFHRLGYTHFRIVNQVKNASFPVPNPSLEGNLVLDPNRNHWSGFFARELPGSRWFTFDEIRRIHGMLHELWTYDTITVGWHDCHAWLPA